MTEPLASGSVIVVMTLAQANAALKGFEPSSGPRVETAWNYAVFDSAGRQLDELAHVPLLRRGSGRCGAALRRR